MILTILYKSINSNISGHTHTHHRKGFQLNNNYSITTEVFMAPFQIFPFLSELFCPLNVYFNYIICENSRKSLKSFKYNTFLLNFLFALAIRFTH